MKRFFNSHPLVKTVAKVQIGIRNLVAAGMQKIPLSRQTLHGYLSSHKGTKNSLGQLSIE